MSEPLLLIPGLNCTAALFAPQRAVLGNDREILVADIGQDDTVAGLARRALADAPDRFALAGLSMGGYVSLEVLRQAPGRVTRLALLDTSARPDSEEATQRRMRLIRIAEHGRFADVHPLLWDRLVAPARRSDRDLEGIVKGMMAQTGPEAFARQQRAIIGRMDSRPGLAAIAVPTLVVVGDQDAITPPAMARELAEAIPGAELLEIADCGHLSTLEQPEVVNDALVRWLAA
ncbi:alpha/beta fold hydrolase [uncultured Alsobacter sp.]|uniref:alpha/beta fold hydrolase n=1 Tax=uncultured Alsobacter sp. TaxID=1748258 RepID=UPI0025E9DE51|nr:alpha/beta fold hydrolase [uncultured Alsobacter sp.]